MNGALARSCALGLAIVIAAPGALFAQQRRPVGGGGGGAPARGAAPVSRAAPAAPAPRQAPVAAPRQAPVATPRQAPAPVAGFNFNRDIAPVSQRQAPIAQRQAAPVVQRQAAPVVQRQPAPVVQQRQPAPVVQQRQPAPVGQQRQYPVAQRQAPVQRAGPNLRPAPNNAGNGPYNGQFHGRVVANPQHYNRAWQWNRGVSWQPAPIYWGGGFWGPWAIGAVTGALMFGAIEDDQAQLTYPSYQVEPDSPGAQLLQNYGLQQTPCGPPDLVVIWGPNNSVICAYPNGTVGEGNYELDPSTLTIVSQSP